MKIFGFNISRESEVPTEQQTAVEHQSSLISSERLNQSSLTVRTYAFNGEKTPGELGDPINLIPDYQALRSRANELNLTNDIIRIITGKFFKWVIGSGLRLQAEPSESVLKFEGVNIDHAEFVDNIETYFDLWANSEFSDYKRQQTFNDLVADAFTTAFLGGDALMIARFDEKNNLTIQVVDGQHVATPFLQGNFEDEAKARGNAIKHGIEIDKQGKHIAYYVVKANDSYIPEFERVEAIGEKSKMKMAWMVYGTKHRIDHHRGVPQISAIIEKIAKMDRFTEATVASAEERAKVPWTIEHSRFSDGSNPLLDTVKRGASQVVESSSYEKGELLSNKISVTENKTVYNLPVDAKFKALDSNAEVNYEPFWKAVFVQLCGSVDIPPEVALQQYNSNYSASRAAINGWEYIVKIYRKKHARQTYQRAYNLYLYAHILLGRYNAPQYLTAVNNRNEYILAAYSKARFEGENMPHIDPKKEADAIRIMLGDATKGEMPLITHEQATERLGNGSYYDNVAKFKEEVKEIPSVKEDSNANSSQTQE